MHHQSTASIGMHNTSLPATPAAAAEKKMLTLCTSDNQEFEVNQSAAMLSETLKKMMIVEDGCADNIVIPLPEVTSHALAKVIEYCNKHAEPTGAGDAEGNLQTFDADFTKVDASTLFDLIRAASFLKITGLLDLTLQAFTDMFKGTSSAAAIPSSAAAEPSSQQMEDSFKACKVYMEKTAKKRMTEFAEYGEEMRKHGCLPTPPPLEIIEYPELLERAWGWDEILQYGRSKPWNLYMKYLKEYHNHNAKFNLRGDDGNGPGLFNLCINKEGELLRLLKSRAQEFNIDEISLNGKLTNCAHQIKAECSGFPALIVSLKCIMAEADLLCKLLKSEIGITSDVTICSNIRKFAFRFMTYKGSEYDAAAGTMIATTKEAIKMNEFLSCAHKYRCAHKDMYPFYRSQRIRQCTWLAMFKILEEYSVEEEPMKFCDEEELVNKDSLLEKNERSQNIEDELPKGNHLVESNEAMHGSGLINETEKLKKEELVNGDGFMGRSEKQKIKGSLERDVPEGSMKVVDHKTKRSKLADLLNSEGFDGMSSVSGKADGNVATSAVPRLRGNKAARRKSWKC